MVAIRWPVHEEDEIAAAAAVLRSGKTNYWTGEHGQAFEQEFARKITLQHSGVAVSSGTTALECAIHALRLDAGEEVIIPCRTFIATAAACVMNGVKPVLADIDMATLNVSVETLERRLTPKTRAVILVHFAGRPIDLGVYSWAEANNLRVIEDCAHAHGAVHPPAHHGLAAGAFGDIACFSFCVGKIMSLGGEGGMCVTQDEELLKRMKRYRDHGKYQMVGSRDFSEFQWTVDEFGSNLRMTEVQAAIGRIQLKKLPAWVDRRRRIAARYNDNFGQAATMHAGHSYYLYVLQTIDRDRIMRMLIERGIPARIGGCPNIGRERVFGGYAEPCPNADKVGEMTLSLPIYPTMTDEDVEEVIFKVKQCL